MNNEEEFIKNYLTSSSRTLRDCANQCSGNILKGALKISKSIEAKGKLLLCGNGGSSSDSQHIEAEFLSTLDSNNFRKALPAISLSTSSSFLTAYSNDFNYDEVFSRQIEALGNEQDVLLAISTSGKSNNVLNALKTATKKGIYTIFLTSEKKPTHIISYDLCIAVPSKNTQHIQECHIAIGHIITRQVEIFLGY